MTLPPQPTQHGIPEPVSLLPPKPQGHPPSSLGLCHPLQPVLGMGALLPGPGLWLTKLECPYKHTLALLYCTSPDSFRTDLLWHKGEGD